MNEKKYFAQLLEQVLAEKKADFEAYKQLIANLPLEERKQQGFTWHPLNVVKIGYTIGERSFVIVEKTSETDAPRQFRAGKTVRLFSLTPGAHKPERMGVINYIKDRKMKIVLNAKDLPEWLSQGNLGVDLQFDERTYLEMEKAIKLVTKASRDRLAELRSILLNKTEARFLRGHPITIPSLNDSQNKAVNQILAAQDVAIIHGPPGTGKTTTIVQAIKQLIKTENTVLVCAPSNAAVDLLTERVAEQGLSVVRLGNISRVDDTILNHTLEAQLAAHPESKNIKKVKIQAAEARKKAGKFKRKFGGKERLERRNWYQEARELTAWANQLEDRLIDQILDGANVITCTLVGANQKVLDKRKFRTVFIDEAAQALEPACWIPIIKSSKVVFAGDPFQLPPTVKSAKSKKEGLHITLVEKALEFLPHISFLNVQYRMHEAIMGFSNQQFYEDALVAADSVKQHTLAIDRSQPVVFIDTAGCGFEEKVNPEFQSRYNPDEFQILCEHLYQVVTAYQNAELPFPNIGIISPYREQVIHMRNQVLEDEKLSNLPLVINTIDAFQGQERDLIYISLVRSNGKGEIGFLRDYRRMNVAMTRARKKLVVLGDSATIGMDAFYGDFLDYCDKVGEYKTAWEYMQ
ncbi:MAG: AAA domain-containing protein [Bacteroidota bacterium]